MKRRRELLGMPSQMALAAKAGVSMKTIQGTEFAGDLERRHMPQQLAIARALKISHRRLMEIYAADGKGGDEYITPGKIKIDSPDDAPETMDATILDQVVASEGRRHFASVLKLSRSEQLAALAYGWALLPIELREQAIRLSRGETK